MGTTKQIKIQNKTDKPDNIVLKEYQILSDCEIIERELPSFLRAFFAYLRGNVLPMTRLAYLRDIKFFFNYLLQQPDLTEAETIAQVTLSELERMKGSDINLFLDYCRKYQVEREDSIYIYKNGNKTLARKKSSLSVMFKHLYRDEKVTQNITDRFDPIRVPKVGEREIKALRDEEVLRMLDAVSTGEHLTKKEYDFWRKTKLRDKTILILFLTYGLRLSELQQLNISSFNFARGEFKIYRKRGKISSMPLNQSTLQAVKTYLEEERPPDDQLEEPEQDALFLSLQKRRMTERQIRELVKKYTSIGLSTSRKAGYSPHKLRATAATSLIGRGNSIFDVQALLDHEQVTTTQLYAAHKMNVKRDLVNDMEWEIERTTGEIKGGQEDK